MTGRTAPLAKRFLGFGKFAAIAVAFCCIATVARAARIDVCGDLSSSTTWTSGNVYVVNDCAVTVAPGVALTIQAGTVVKFAATTSVLLVRGTLLAQGSAGAQVVFTSLKDDAHGGDTGGDGATAGSPAQWSSIRFDAGSHGQLQYVLATFGGSGFYDRGGRYNLAIVESFSSDVTLDHVTLRSSGNNGLYASGASVNVTNSTIADNASEGLYYDGVDSVAALAVTDNAFSGNGVRAGRLHLTDTPAQISFQRNTATGSKNGFRADGALGPGSLLWDNGGSLVFFVNGGLVVRSGATLTVTAGSVIKFGDTRDILLVQGSLEAMGTEVSPISFTSLADDSRGGDTNGDGASAGAPGQWAGVRFDTGGRGELQYAFAGFGGSGFYDYFGRYNAGIVEAFSSDVTLEHVTLSRSGNNGLYASDSSVAVTSSQATDNAQYGLLFDGVDPLAPLRVSDSSFSGNGAYAGWLHFRQAPGDVTFRDNHATGARNGFRASGRLQSGSLEWDNEDNLPLVVDGGLAVSAGAALTLQSGSVVKFAGPTDTLLVEGSLTANGTAGAQIVFTSVADDERGGDTNGDGASTGSPGQWAGIRFASGSHGRITNAFVGFGGSVYYDAFGRYNLALIESFSNDVVLDGVTLYGSGLHGLYAENASVEMIRGRVEANAGFGLYYKGLDTATPLVVTDNVFAGPYGSAGRLELNGNPPSITFERNTNAGGGFVSGFRLTGTLDRDTVWSNTGSLPLVIDGGLTVSPAATLTVLPGTVVKFAGAADVIVVRGGLIADGTEVAPIAFTSIADDAHGGDTNGDGTASAAAPGNWAGLRFVAGSFGHLQSVFVGYGGSAYYDYGGAYNKALIESYSSALELADCTLQKSGLSGLYAGGASVGVVSSQIRDNTQYGLYYDGVDPESPLAVLDNSFSGNGTYGARLHIANTAGQIRLEGNSASGGKNGFRVDGLLGSGAMLWDNPAQVVVVDGGLIVAATASLTAAPGSMVKFAGGRDVLAVEGTLSAQGTFALPIAFTSIADDTHGGDTNGDGPSAGLPGQWAGLRFSSGGQAQIAHAFIAYGGSGNFDYTGRYNRALVEAYASDVQIDYTSLQSSQLSGLYADSATVRLRYGSVSANQQGVSNATPSFAVNARRTWWGDASGPKHPKRNPAGKGDSVSDGVIFTPWLDEFDWLEPDAVLLHGTERLSWGAFGEGAADLRAEIWVVGTGQSWTLGSGLASSGEIEWDTGSVPGGRYELRAEFYDSGSQLAGQATKSVTVNNAAGIAWHRGRIVANEVWDHDLVHVVQGDVIVTSGAHLVISPGTVVKFEPGARIYIEAGGTLDAGGAEGEIVVLTSIFDDLSGDTNLDSTQSLPRPGDWGGIAVAEGGQFLYGPFTDVRYAQTEHAGALAGSERWLGTLVHRITSDVIVPAGVTLTIDRGAVIKLDAFQGIEVQAGGMLIAAGEVARPIVVTSSRDDTAGGDTNQDGDSTAPAAGDWRWIFVNGGQAALDHVDLRYGGGTSSGNWEMTGVIRTSPGAVVSLSSSVIRDAFYEGVTAWGGGDVTITNSVIARADRGVNSDGSAIVRIDNSTIDGCRIGVWGHSGRLEIANTVVSNSAESGIDNIGSSPLTLRYSDVWSNTGSNYTRIADQTGLNGNVSADPRYVARAHDDFRLDYRSPVIDAADGTVAPATDATGAPRYDDPRTTNAGIATSTGAFADMGAFEFVETAESPLDLVPSSVGGPASAVSGETARVAWTITNAGTGEVVGPWHDTVNLVFGAGDNPTVIFAAEVIVGEGARLGPGQSLMVAADVRVPGSIVAAHRWQVVTNTKGEVFEGRNRGNNTATSLATVAIDLPELAIDGTPLSRQFDAAGEAHWFKVNPVAGQDVLVSVDRAGVGGATELYLGQGYMPTRQLFDARQVEPSAADVSALAASASGQTYYVLAYPASLPSGTAAFTIDARALDFALDSVGPTAVGNGGSATLTLRGGQLRSDMIFEIVDAQGGVHRATSVFAVDSALVYATFNLNGLPVGAYDVRVRAGERVATLDGGVEVVAGNPGQVQAYVSMPNALRPDWTGTLTVEYVNAGLTDVVAPLMVVTAQNARLRLPTHPTFGDSAIQLLGINKEGPAGVLPPGARGTITLEMMPTIGNGVIDATVRVLSKPQQAVDWNAMKSQMRPAFVPADAWGPIFANFTAEVGSTLGGYQAVLAANATYLSRLGVYTHDVERLVAFELRQAALGDIGQRYSVGVFGRGAPVWWEMTASADGQDAVAVRAGSQTRTFLRQPDGSYRGVEGDEATLTAQGGSYRLREANGSIFAFRTDGKLDYSEDSAGRRVAATYSAGHLTGLSDAAGNTLSYAYDGYGHVIQVVDPAGRATTYDYDAGGEHLVRMRGPDGDTTFDYVTGQGAAREHALASIHFPDGTARYFEYDERGRLVREHDGDESRAVTYAYDSAGGMTITDAAGAVQTLLFDDAGQLARVIDPLGNAATVAYHQGQPTRMVDPGGAVSLFEYDAQGNLSRVVDPVGSRLALSYEADSDQVTSVANARGATLRYEYDEGGDLQRIIYPDGNSEQFAYAADGNLSVWTNGRGQTIGFAYDEYGLLARKTLTGHSIDLQSDVDRNLKSVTGARGTTLFEYDAAGRLTRMTTPEGRFLKMDYDEAGRLIRKTDQDGFVVNYAYDDAGRLAELTDGGDAPIVSYVYDIAGRLERKDLGNGTSTTYGYDLAGEVQSVINREPGGALISRYDYTYDVRGRRSRMQTPDGAWSYTYDAAGQLTHAAFTSTNPGLASQDLTYEYDAAGNRTRTIVNGSVATYAANASDQYVSDGMASFTYDADGNPTRRDAGTYAWQYGYDEEGRLVSAEGPDGSWTWEYDAFGQRVASVHDGVRTEYLVDPLTGDVTGEYAADGALIARYEHGLGLVRRAAADGSAAYYHFDALGSTTEMTGPDGSVVNRYAYFPFGRILSREETVANDFEFLGELDVAATAGHLCFMRRRYFDPMTGRFLQRDPAGVNGGANLYAYSGNDPINAVDPTGLGVIDELVEVALDAPLEAKEIWELRKFLTNPKYSSGSRGLFWDQFLNAVGKMSPTELTRRLGTGEVSLRDIRLAKLRQTMIDVAAKKPFLRRWIGKAGNAWRSSKSWFGGFTKRMSGYAGRVTTWARPYAAKALHVLGRAVVVVDVAVAIWDGGSWIAGKLGWKDVADAMDSVWTSEGLKTAWDYYFGSSRVVSSHDPNDLLGPAGFGDEHWVGPEQILPYTIRFENDAQATAPAQVVRITQQLDPDLSYASFELGSFGFGDVVVTVPPGRSFYSDRLDLRATHGLFLDISASIDMETGLVTWELVSIDPATGEVPRDPLSGFLPPNVTSPIGQGFVSYTIRPRLPVDTGRWLDAQARIVFDTNEPIDTPPFLNTVDADAPSSSVNALPEVTYSLRPRIRWTGTDGGSGIASYDLYVSVDGGAFQQWVAGTNNTSAVVEVEYYRTYAFYSIARDYTGHVEVPPAGADAMTSIEPLAGDANCDGVLTAADIPALIRAFDATSSGPCGADTEGDGDVDAADLRALLGKIFAPPP